MIGRSRARGRWVAAAVCVVALTGACGQRNRTDAEEVRAAVGRTERAARGVVYSDTEAGRQVVVRALVADDLRFKADLAVNGTVVFDRGQVLTRGPADDVLNDERVIEAYLGGTEAAVRRSGEVPS